MTAQSEAARQAFYQGNAAFQNNDPAAAIAAYEAALAEGHSANLHFNLAKAYYAQGQIGPAVLHLERALALNPDHAEARASLDFVRREGELLSWTWPRWQQLGYQLSIAEWSWLAALLFWSGCLLGLFAYLQPAWRKGLRPLVVLLWLGLLPCLVGLAAWHLRAAEGVILGASTPLLVAPSASSPVLHELVGGTLVQVKGTQGNYERVQLASGREGYVAQSQVGQIWFAQ